MAVPNYLNNVVGFHLDRVRTGWEDRREQVRVALEEAPVVAGAIAAGWLLARGGSSERAIAAHALATTGLIAVAGNSLSVMYFLPVLPLLAVCTASAAPPRVGVAVPVALVLVLVLRGPAVVRTIDGLTGPNAEHAACIDAVRAAPGRFVLAADGRIALLTGKELPADYYATDPNALHLLEAARFHEWFDRMLSKADAVVVTSQLVEWMSRANARQLLASAKPVFFDQHSTRSWFETKFQPAKSELPAGWPDR
jgi:hypothetical protein